MNMGCNLEHWMMENYTDDVSSYRNKMQMAEKCKDFKEEPPP